MGQIVPYQVRQAGALRPRAHEQSPEAHVTDALLVLGLLRLLRRLHGLAVPLLGLGLLAGLRDLRAAFDVTLGPHQRPLLDGLPRSHTGPRFGPRRISYFVSSTRLNTLATSGGKMSLRGISSTLGS